MVEYPATPLRFKLTRLSGSAIPLINGVVSLVIRSKISGATGGVASIISVPTPGIDSLPIALVAVATI